MELKRDPDEVRADGTTMGSYSMGAEAPETEENSGGLDSTFNDGSNGVNDDDGMPFFDPEAEFDPVTPMMTAGMNSGIDNGDDPLSQQPAGYNNGDNYNTYNSGTNTYNYTDRYHVEGEERPRKLTKTEFFNKMALRKIKDRINYSSLGLIACSIISMIATWFIIDTVLKPMYEVVDSYSQALGMDTQSQLPDLSALMAGVVIFHLIIIGLAFGIMFGKSRVCAAIALAISAYNMISTFVQTHRITGYLPLIASVYAVYATVEFNNAWKQYDTTGHYPGVD